MCLTRSIWHVKTGPKKPSYITIHLHQSIAPDSLPGSSKQIKCHNKRTSADRKSGGHSEKVRGRLNLALARRGFNRMHGCYSKSTVEIFYSSILMSLSTKHNNIISKRNNNQTRDWNRDDDQNFTLTTPPRREDNKSEFSDRWID